MIAAPVRILAAAAAALLSPATLAGNMSLVLDGIPGSIEVLSFDFGVENPITIGSATGGAGAGKAKFNEFNIVANESASSPSQFSRLNTGIHFPSARLTVLHPETGKPHSEWGLTTVFATKLSVRSGVPDPKAKAPNTFLAPVTTFTVLVGKACYRVFAGDGSVATESCWNQVTNTAN